MVKAHFSPSLADVRDLGNPPKLVLQGYGIRISDEQKDLAKHVYRDTFNDIRRHFLEMSLDTFVMLNFTEYFERLMWLPS